ncbi:uncharacterized protein LOC126319889 isoform X1 [Schistocerca gregaria]|uniref:uncharacterized protein LOC126319889 isoform X1 n=1 Tax=Schistocerca gregaria TaxID=7010 RepID=UPI00211DDEAA|nr:uncharacterized protein LOC126319889 isoform X1 [Schistocerca gregaria]
MQSSKRTRKDSAEKELYVEVCLFDQIPVNFALVEAAVRQYIEHTIIECLGLFDHSKTTNEVIKKNVKEIRIDADEDVVPLPISVKLDGVNHEPAEQIDENDDVASLNILPLPSLSLHGLWESLLFEFSVKNYLMSYASTALTFTLMQVDSQIVTWNRVVLLHGPPGTGKTSLCKALAHRLSIRFCNQFREFQLIEINAHSLFSKWFSESGKLVMKVFRNIRELTEDRQRFVCVLIDEVESLTAARTRAVSGSEPSDALRAVNAMLTELDRLKSIPNVMILTTSNITEAIDQAFLDRADIVQYIGPPGVKARHEILSSCVSELLKRGIIYVNGGAQGDYLSKMASDTEKDLLTKVAICSEGLSGRAIRRLPFIASTRQCGKSVELVTYLDMLNLAVVEMKDRLTSTACW